MAKIDIAGYEEGVAAQIGETVLEALLREFDGVPYSCQSGNCGTCKCRYLGGAIRERPHGPDALSKAQRAQGIILMCSTEVMGDVRIQFLDSLFD